MEMNNHSLHSTYIYVWTYMSVCSENSTDLFWKATQILKVKGYCSQSLNPSLGKLKISPAEKISWHLLFEKIALFQELPHVAEIYLPSVWTLKIFHLN